jgi:hypothetical protein
MVSSGLLRRVALVRTKCYLYLFHLIAGICVGPCLGPFSGTHCISVVVVRSGIYFLCLKKDCCIFQLQMN